MSGSALLQETRFAVGGMDCGSCVRKIETALGRLPGVDEVTVSLAGGAVTVRHDTSITPPHLRDIIARLGFTPEDTPPPRQEAQAAASSCCGAHGSCGDARPVAAAPAAAPPRPWWQSQGMRQILLTGAVIAVAYGVSLLAPSLERWAFLAAVVLGGFPIVRRALVSARYGTVFSIEMLMSIAAVAAVAIGAEEEAAAVLFLFLIGEMLESVAADRARAGIRSLTALMPRTCRRETAAGTVEEIAAERLAIGDTLQVRPGDRIAADGLILSGTGGVDESPLTGESLPRLKAPGDGVHAGTINGDSTLRVRVTADAHDNTLARIVRLVEEAQEKKAPTARFIERFARYYTPAVVAVAALVAVLPPLLFGGAWEEWIYRAAAVLLIGCPCALVISTPAAIAAGLSAGARSGLLMKGGAVLEDLGRVTLVAFDKTGTLTLGKPQVTDVVALSGTRRDILAEAAALSQGSSHPLAGAILRAAAAEGLPTPSPRQSTALPGHGVEADVNGAPVFLGSLTAAAERADTSALAAVVEPLVTAGKTLSVLVRDGAVAGVIALRDEVRPDAATGIARLRRLGVEAMMVTGDTPAAAARVAADLGIPAHAGLLPEDKLEIVRRHQAEGAQVAKVGDGINDAPALAAARVGIAMGGGTDVALETADAASLHGRVGDVAAMIALSRHTLRVVRQNVAVALGLKLLLLVTTLIGVTGLWPAVLADTGATVLVTANALRLLRRRAV